MILENNFFLPVFGNLKSESFVSRSFDDGVADGVGASKPERSFPAPSDGAFSSDQQKHDFDGGIGGGGDFGGKSGSSRKPRHDFSDGFAKGFFANSGFQFFFLRSNFWRF